MKGKSFFDTTILIYAVSNGDERVAVAQQLLHVGGSLSVQILNEFVSVARRKLAMSWQEIAAALRDIRLLCGTPAPLTVQTHERGLAIAERYGYRIYDALVLAAALEEGCDMLYSEDMQHGQTIDSLTIINPFRQV